MATSEWVTRAPTLYPNAWAGKSTEYRSDSDGIFVSAVMVCSRLNDIALSRDHPSRFIPGSTMSRVVRSASLINLP